MFGFLHHLWVVLYLAHTYTRKHKHTRADDDHCLGLGRGLNVCLALNVSVCTANLLAASTHTPTHTPIPSPLPSGMSISIAVCLGAVVKMSLCLKFMWVVCGVWCVGGVGGQAMLKQLGPAPQGFESVSRHVFIGSQGARALSLSLTHSLMSPFRATFLWPLLATYNSLCV